MWKQDKSTGVQHESDANQEHAPNISDGELVTMFGNKFVMVDAAGKEHSYTLAPHAKLTCDGADCKPSDPLDSSRIRVTTKNGEQKTATCVEVLDTQSTFARSIRT